MSRPGFLTCVCHLLVGLAALAAAAAGSPTSGTLRIAATSTTLEFAFPTVPRAAWVLEEMPALEDAAQAAAAARIAWQGPAPANGKLELPRFAAGHDRLYRQFRLRPEAGRGALAEPQFVSDLSLLPAPAFAFPWPRSIKGLTCPVDVADVKALGAKYVNDNVVLHELFDWSGGPPAATWTVDGETFALDMRYIQKLDAKFQALTAAGMNVTAIINNQIPRPALAGNPLVHPATNTAQAPYHLAAINLTEPRGVRRYRAALEFLAERYSRPDARHGWVSGYIIGNEVQNHWQWYNIGEMPLEPFVRHYALALRLADLAVRSRHGGLRVYVSMDRHWTQPDSFNPGRAFAGREFLERFAAATRAQGDFPWHVAFHPYADNAFEPRFWLEREPRLDLNTPIITFKNLEVLPVFLGHAAMRHAGQPRRVILSEQGFHAPEGAEGEALQAAAFAYAYHKTSLISGIDAFMLHRHASARDEGGLRLGLRDWTEQHPPNGVLGRPLRSYDVFRLADTDGWREAFAFALPLIGIRDWSELAPAAAEVIERNSAAAQCEAQQAEAGVIADLYAQAGTAITRDCALAPHMVEDAGQVQRAFMQHPPRSGWGEAEFQLDLPAARSGRVLVFEAAAQLAGKSSDGVRYRVAVNGTPRWTGDQQAGPGQPVRIDLTAWAGQRIRLTLATHAIREISFDWALWVRPRVRWASP